MLVACWSVKGGSGTTVVAAALALLLARRHRAGVLLVDGAGDLPDVLGLDDAREAPSGGGLADWVGAGPAVPADALARLERPAADGLAVLPWAAPSAFGPPAPVVPAERWDDLVAHLRADARVVVADCGSGARAGHEPAGHLAPAAAASLLVLRPCFVALRRAGRAGRRATGVVLVEEPGRSLGPVDVEEVLGLPVVAEVDHHRSVANAVDGGLAVMGLPRSLSRDLGPLADRLAAEAA